MVGDMTIILFHLPECMQNNVIEVALVTHQKGINALSNQFRQDGSQILTQISCDILMSKKATSHIHHAIKLRHKQLYTIKIGFNLIVTAYFSVL